MFDDVNKEGKQSTSGGGEEPIDIFSDADVATPVVGDIMEEGVKTGGFPIKIVAIIVGVVVVLGVGGFGVYQFVLKKPAPAPIEDVINTEQPVQEDTNTGEVTNTEQPVEQPVSESTTTPAQSGQIAPLVGEPSVPVVPPASVNATPPADSDGDGLTDEEELKYGTDKNVVDTDNDGLSDREEIQVYKTNPLNPDTDGDGFSDSTEVKGGYNPNGPGKLVTIPSEQSATPSVVPTPVK